MAGGSLASDKNESARSVLPVLLAPMVAGIYYLVIKLAFAESVVSVMGRTDLFEIPHWGSHWAFRITAEVIAVGFGTFVSAGLAHGREKTAAIVGGCAISMGFVVKLLLAYLDPDVALVPEPWYQYAIDVLSVAFAPIIGAFVAETATDLHRSESRGLGGINRLHFLWLWPVAYFYALGLITPVARLYTLSNPNIVTSTIALVINGIPAAALLIPGYYGLAFLSGHHGNTMHPAGRSMVGALVLISGFLIGAGIQSGWYWVFQKIYGAIFN